MGRAGRTFSAALVALVFALIRGNAAGWTSAVIIGCLAGPERHVLQG